MSDMYFKSLPDTSTPLIPENLNKLNDIKVSPTEPATNEKVWIQYSKNRLNPYNKHNTSASYDFTNDTYKLTSEGSIYLLCKVVVGNTYTLSYKNNNGFASIRASDYNYGGSWLEYGRGTTADGKITFIATTDTVVVQFVGGAANSSTIQKVQLEEGSTPTEYEKFVQTNIYAKSNGSYEKLITENNVIASSVQPGIGGLWIKTGKNLSKISGFNAVSAHVGRYVVKEKVEPNKTYTISAIKTRLEGVTMGNVMLQGLGAIKAYDALGNQVADFFEQNAHYLDKGSVRFQFTITVPENADYIIADFGNNNGDYTENASVSQIQIEQGLTATSYEPYIEKAIYVKNDNDVYEKFYKERQIETVDISLENGSGSAGFPVGFTVENCIIIGHIDKNKYGVSFGNISDISVMLNGDNNNIQATGTGNFSGNAARTKVVLMKLY